MGYYNAAGIDSAGGLWTWGRGNRQNLGDGSAAHRPTPAWIGGANTWVQVSIGDGHSAAIDNSGRLWTWGKNYSGELGQGDALHRDVPTQVGVNTIWRNVSCGDVQTVTAIKTDGTLWVWGNNPNGYSLPTDTGGKSSPVQSLAAGTNWVQSSITAQGGCAVKSDGTLWTWGSNRRGMLGDNTTIQKSSPVQTIAGGTNWKQCSAGGYAMAAIKTDGTLWGWGNNQNGTLGVNDITHRSSPVQTIMGGTNWKQVSTKGSVTLALVFVDP
jgi:alpha-tubulin suppressor-like RCC1 family protein